MVSCSSDWLVLIVNGTEVSDATAQARASDVDMHLDELLVWGSVVLSST